MIHSFYLHDMFYSTPQLNISLKPVKEKSELIIKKQLVHNYQGSFDGRFVFDGFILSIFH